jgi:hypothetical protein
MRKVMCILLILAVFASVSACVGEDVPEPYSPEEVPVLPEHAVLPNTMLIDDFFVAVNSLIDFEEGYEFDRQFAEIFDVPISEDDNEVLYIIDMLGFEVVLVADRDTDALLLGYLRMSRHETVFALNMLSTAGAFMMVLEPNEYEDMLLEVIPLDGNDDFWETGHLDARISTGEVWTIMNQGSLVNFFPSIED